MESDVGRTTDPVRMYMREMGSVELLSREGEIAIAKRIEAGRDAMISGLCESALTFEAIMVWRDELENNRILLREVIDLDATYGVLNPSSVPGAAQPEGEETEEEAAPAEAKPESDDEDDDDFDDGGGMSISALEAELRDGVMEVLNLIAADFGAFRQLQDKLVQARLKGEALSAKDEKAYQALTTSISDRLKTMKLNNNRIEALVEQLYAINKRLIGLEGRLLRLADSYGISRPEFLKAYFGAELDPTWSERVKEMGVRWTKFSENESGQIALIRSDIAAVATEAGAVEAVTEGVEDVALDDVADRHGNWLSGVDDLGTADEAVGRCHGHGTDKVVTEVLSDLEGDGLCNSFELDVDVQCVV